MLRYLENEFNPKKGGRKPVPYDGEDEEEKEDSMITPGYKLRRDLMGGEGERLDTVEGDDDDTGRIDCDDDEKNETDRIEVNLDDVNDDDDNESLLNSRNNGDRQGLFTITASNDRGLADMETGSEVYMSELLVSTHLS